MARILDCKGLRCPMPLVKLNGLIKEIAIGDEVEVQATDPAFLPDIEAWAEHTGNRLKNSRKEGEVFFAVVEKMPKEE